MRRLLRGAGHLLAAVWLVTVLVHLGLDLAGRISRADDASIFGPQFLLLTVFVLGSCLRAATMRSADPAVRRPWRLVTAGVFLLIAYGATYGLSSDAAGVPAASRPLLAVLTVFRVGIVVLLLGALATFDGEPLGRRGRVKLTLDVAVVGGGLLMLAWYVLVGPALGALGGAASDARFLPSVWAVADLLILAGVCRVLLRGTTGSTRRSVLLLLAGLVVYALQDQMTAVQVARHPLEPLPVWASYTGMVALVCLGLAAREQCRSAALPPTAATSRRTGQHPSVPFLALGVGFGLLAVAAARFGGALWPGLVGGGLLMSVSVAARQALLLQENHRLTVTDALTGLANRTPLWGAIERSAARSRRHGVPMAVLLFDLDKFKPVNDDHGHEAGDEMLVTFAQVLSRHVRVTDLAARLGGDEFAVVLDQVTPEQAVSVARRVIELAGRHHLIRGNRMPIHCSVGIALGDPVDPAGIPDAQELLHRADQAMYQAKRSGVDEWAVFGAGWPAGATAAPAGGRRWPTRTS